MLLGPAGASHLVVVECQAQLALVGAQVVLHEVGVLWGETAHEMADGALWPCQPTLGEGLPGEAQLSHGWRREAGRLPSGQTVHGQRTMAALQDCLGAWAGAAMQRQAPTGDGERQGLRGSLVPHPREFWALKAEAKQHC